MGADITYLPTAGKLVYLSLVTNAYSRKIVGYHVHMSLQTEEVSEPLLAEMDSFVAQLLPHLLPLLDKPYFLFGHSNGALLAFAVANRLLRAGARPPAGIILSGKRSPSRDLVRERVSQLPDDALLARLQNLNGTPQELLREPDIMRLFFPAIRADFSLGETYELEDMDPILASIAALILAGDEDPAGIAEVFSWTDLFPAAATIFSSMLIQNFPACCGHSAAPGITRACRKALPLCAAMPMVCMRRFFGAPHEPLICRHLAS